MDPIEPLPAPATGKDYIVEVRIKNGPMLRAIRSAGFDNAAQFCKAHGLALGTIYGLLNLTAPALTRTGEWRPAVIKLSGILQCLPEDLFPRQHYRRVLLHNRAEIELDFDEMQHLLSAPTATAETLMIQDQALASIREHIDQLLPRYKLVLELRFGLGDEEPMTYDQIGKVLGVTRERVRQMEQQAMRKLRGPKHNKAMASNAEDLGVVVDPAYRSEVWC